MANFYLSNTSSISDEEAETFAENELKQLQEVKRFYKGCCFEFDEKDSKNLEMLEVKFNFSFEKVIYPFFVESIHLQTSEHLP